MSANPNPIESRDAIQRLAALRLLDARKGRLGIEISAARKSWADKLGEKTKELNKQIELPNPGKMGPCKDRLDQIRSLYEDRKELEDSKKRAIDKLTAEMKKVEASLVEIIRADLDDSQQELELEESAGPSLNMSSDAAKVVTSAITAFKADGGELTADEQGLEETLRNMGAFGLGPDLSLVDDD